MLKIYNLRKRALTSIFLTIKHPTKYLSWSQFFTKAFGSFFTESNCKTSSVDTFKHLMAKGSIFWYRISDLVSDSAHSCELRTDNNVIK